MKIIKNLKTLLITVGVVGSFSIFNCFAMQNNNNNIYVNPNTMNFQRALDNVYYNYSEELRNYINNQQDRHKQYVDELNEKNLRREEELLSKLNETKEYYERALELQKLSQDNAINNLSRNYYEDVTALMAKNRNLRSEKYEETSNLSNIINNKDQQILKLKSFIIEKEKKEKLLQINKSKQEERIRYLSNIIDSLKSKRQQNEKEKTYAIEQENDKIENRNAIRLDFEFERIGKKNSNDIRSGFGFKRIGKKNSNDIRSGFGFERIGKKNSNDIRSSFEFKRIGKNM